MGNVDVDKRKLAVGRVVRILLEKGWTPPSLEQRTVDDIYGAFERNGLPRESILLRQKNDVFTEKQLEILQLAAQGKTARQIGKELHLSEKTVKYHNTNMLRSTKFRNMTQAVAFAVSEGWITSSGLPDGS